jgi:sRNA-binding carbon storage regulator CsrA
MLMLTGEAGQRIVIDHRIVIEVLEVKEQSVVISIEMPPGTRVATGELQACAVDDEFADGLAREFAGVS